MAMGRLSWAMICRQGNGEKVVQYQENSWMTENLAEAVGFEVVNYEGTWMTAQRRRELENRTFEIMAMPKEVRLEILSNMIERYALPVFLAGRYGPLTGMPLPPIAYTTKTLRLEFLMVTLENTRFEIHSGKSNDQFQKWLIKIDLSSVSTSYTNGFDAVKRLSFPFASRYPHTYLPVDAVNNDIELMRKCRNLREVHMKWAGQEVIDETGKGKSVAQLILEYRLDGLLDLKQLEVLYFHRHYTGYEGLYVLQELTKWFRAQYERQKQDPADSRTKTVRVVVI